MKQIDFVLFAPDVYEAWVEAAEELSKGPVTDDGEAAGGTKKKPAAEQVRGHNMLNSWKKRHTCGGRSVRWGVGRWILGTGEVEVGAGC